MSAAQRLVRLLWTHERAPICNTSSSSLSGTTLPIDTLVTSLNCPVVLSRCGDPSGAGESDSESETMLRTMLLLEVSLDESSSSSLEASLLRSRYAFKGERRSVGGGEGGKSSAATA